ncbi:MAG: hypothetical protein K8T20_13485 [Planctomycetes bacterium]|nr:hypothetical protein [Planctomycetota bacterium]
MPKTILLVHHENERLDKPLKYLVNRIREEWTRAGWRVVDTAGTRRRVEADVAFLHANLTVVPQEYQDFVLSYPVAINAHVLDTRKKQDYRIYDSAREVPPEVFRCEDLVVEKFLPEMHDGLYCLREWYFLGDASVNNVELWRDPVITSGNDAPDLREPTPPELVALRRELGIDYGKIDYVMHEGRPVVFDVNKTMGTGSFMSEGTTRFARILAQGLNSLLAGSMAPFPS